MAWMIQESNKINPATAEGVYNLKLAVTGDVEQAKQAYNEFRRQELENQWGNNPLPE